MPVAPAQHLRDQGLVPLVQRPLVADPPLRLRVAPVSPTATQERRVHRVDLDVFPEEVLTVQQPDRAVPDSHAFTSDMRARYAASATARASRVFSETQETVDPSCSPAVVNVAVCPSSPDSRVRNQ